jgi:signal transduction histidine kinase
VRVAQPGDARGLPDRVLWDILIRLGVLVVLLLVAVRWIARPLSVLAQAADRLGRNLDEAPIPEDGPSEVRRAAQAFNGMQVRLRGLVREKGRMLAAVSHDLKTPITRLRLRAEMLTDGELRTKIGRDLDEMEAMVSATLDLMRGAAGEEQLQRTDLVALVESLQADYEDMNHAIDVAADDVRPVEVRPRALRRCLANLVDNGLKYATNVRIAVKDGAQAVTLVVEDDGPGIPAAELDRVFEPFYRVESSRNRETGGSGLGLSIARAIAIEHAGTLSLANRPQGGLRATLVLPRR